MSLSFTQLATQFLSWCEKCKRGSTTSVYRHYLKKFAAHNGDLEAAAVRPAHVTQYAKTWHDVQAVKRLFRWAFEEAGLLESNPLTRLKHPPKGMRRRIFAAGELAGIMRAVKPDLRRLLLAYRETMARPGELRNAAWDDVHGDCPSIDKREALATCRASIVLYEFKCRDRRADSEAPRIIILSPVACRLLLWLYDRSTTKAGAIFQTATHRAWTPNAVRCRFRRMRAKAGIVRDKRGETIVPYTFRHHAATMAAAAGIRDRVLADVLGHVETKTTARYQHLLTDHLRAALEKLWDKPR